MDSNQGEKYELMKPDERAAALANETSAFLNVARFEQMQRVASMLSKSDFVPERFRGNIGNCMVALDMASLMRMHPIMLMRQMYIVHGSPGFTGQFVSALLNNSKRYVDPIEYEWKSEKGKPDWGCRAFAIRKSSGKKVHGPWVDWQMVQKEKWNVDKPYRDGKGVQLSKWNTMPEIMFRYRAASFFGRANDADLLMGMQTIDEIEDQQTDMIKASDGTYTVLSDEKPTGKTYAVNAKPPLQSDPAATPSENVDEIIPEILVDEFGTPKDSPFEKSKWFLLKAGSPEDGTGFAAYVLANADKMGPITGRTYEALKFKYEKLYGIDFPYDPMGNPIKQPESESAANDDETIDDEPETKQPEPEPEDDASILESTAAKLLASMAKKHVREYIMVVKGRKPESVDQIYQWVEEINQLVVKHAQEKPSENEEFT